MYQGYHYSKITELLEEVKPKKKTRSSQQLEDVLRTLREALLSLPSTPQVKVGPPPYKMGNNYFWLAEQLSEGLGLIPGKVKYPLHFTPENCKGNFKFGPPSGVRVVGSYLLGTLTKPDLAVDLELSLPMVCWKKVSRTIF